MELSLAFGIAYGIPNIVSFVAGYTNYGAYKQFGMGHAILIDAASTFVSLIFSFKTYNLEQLVI